MKKKHQHFIPRTYLKNFAHTQNGDTFLIDAYGKTKGEVISNMSVADICVETDLYTLKHLEGNGKYKIEDFFSENIENKYPKIYRLLVEEKKQIISPEERVLIFYTTLSMYFRTPKILNQFVAFSANLIQQLKSEKDIDSIYFLGYEFSLKDKSFAEIKKEIKETNRINFIKPQLALLEQFVSFKAFDSLVVIELVGEQEFITSDNPVEIRNSLIPEFNLFDAGNSIYVPLDPKHALLIAPRLEKSIVNQVFYQRDNFFHHVILNHRVFENAERWVLGTRLGVRNFLEDEEKYTKPVSDDHPLVVKMETKLELMETLEKLARKGISNDNKELVVFLKKLRKHPLYKESVEFQDAYKTLKNIGLRI